MSRPMTEMLKTLQTNLFFILLLLSLYQIGITGAAKLSTQTQTTETIIQTTQTDLQNETIPSFEQNTSTALESTADNNTIIKQLPMKKPNEELRALFIEVISPTLCVMGIIGNIINLLVLSRKEMHGSTNCFLIALAVSDMLLLAMQIPPSISSTSKYEGMTPTYIVASRYLFIIQYVTSNIFITCTSWLTVAITIERFIAIRFALKARLICTVHRAKVAIAAIFLVSFLFHISKCFEHGPNLDHTNPIPYVAYTLGKSKTYNSIMHVLNIGVAVFIPEVSLFILNTLLVYSLVQHNKSMRHIKDSGRHELLQLTIVVITMVSVFMICHSIGLYLAISIAVHSRKVLVTPTGARLRVINNFLVLINSSVNFILYTAISKRFRDSFNNLFCQCFRKTRGKIGIKSKASTSSNTKSTSSGKSRQIETPA